METILDWISGISWGLVYLVALCIGIRKKTYCIPAGCICLNFSWEVWVVVVRIVQHSSLNSGFISQILWLILDIGVLYTWIRFANGSVLRKVWLIIGALILMSMATLVFGFWAETAFVINLIMSVFFLFQIDKQMHSSMLIALLKCIGTLPATILNGIIHGNYLILAIGGLCLIADVYYIYDIWKQKTVIKK